MVQIDGFTKKIALIAWKKIIMEFKTIINCL
jgi:hypothetical protein